MADRDDLFGLHPGGWDRVILRHTTGTRGIGSRRSAGFTREESCYQMAPPK